MLQFEFNPVSSWIIFPPVDGPQVPQGKCESHQKHQLFGTGREDLAFFSMATTHTFSATAPLESKIHRIITKSTNNTFLYFFGRFPFGQQKEIFIFFLGGAS